MKNEETEGESESCALSLVVWFSSQLGSLAEGENEGESRGGGKENTREREKMGM